jgi:hypothetical protein
MSILEMQKAFTSVLMDEQAREAYLTDADTFLSSYDLTARERSALAHVSVPRLRAYASMLMYSRLDLGLKALPHARALLPRDFVPRYGARYVREYPRPPGETGGPLLRELKLFAAFLEQLAREGEVFHDAFVDALHYDTTLHVLGDDPAIYAAVVEFERRVQIPGDEAALLHARLERAPGVVVREFMHELIDQGAGAALPLGPRVSSPILVLFHKRGGERAVGIHRINAATRWFLQLCDGRRSVAGIALEMAAERPDAPEACLGLARALASRGVIGAIGGDPGP